MSSFFEIFSPNMRFQREQKDVDKMLVVKTPAAGKGPVQVDLDKGTIVLRRDGAQSAVEDAPATAPARPVDDEDDDPIER